jgi:hypothetical protein
MIDTCSIKFNIVDPVANYIAAPLEVDTGMSPPAFDIGDGPVQLIDPSDAKKLQDEFAGFMDDV